LPILNILFSFKERRLVNPVFSSESFVAYPFSPRSSPRRFEPPQA
jgi:hypothetical protein